MVFKCFQVKFPNDQKIECKTAEPKFLTVPNCSRCPGIEGTALAFLNECIEILRSLNEILILILSLLLSNSIYGRVHQVKKMHAHFRERYSWIGACPHSKESFISLLWICPWERSEFPQKLSKYSSSFCTWTYFSICGDAAFETRQIAKINLKLNRFNFKISFELIQISSTTMINFTYLESGSIENCHKDERGWDWSSYG